MARWNISDIPPLLGRVAVVTGANSGLGFETALALAGAGAKVVLACRDQIRGTIALDRIRSSLPSAQVRLSLLDLADLSSIRSFAERFAGESEGLDILVNNAGVMAIPRRETADRFEMQIGTNHLGHFALTGLLLGGLLVRPGARVVTVSSLMARIGKLNFGDLQGRQHYGKWSAYGQSKLASQLFALELDRRARHRGVDLISVAAHPGYAATNLQEAGLGKTGASLQRSFNQMGSAMFAQSAAAGALPSLYGATADGVSGGQYFGPDRFFGSRGNPKRIPFVPRARDLETAQQLWTVSEELTGVSFVALEDADPVASRPKAAIGG